jgi:glycosyltransferase involved in cell wall biosynthesis
MAGNPYLADYARQTNQNVSIVPTTIDTDKYKVVQRSYDERRVPVIGWSGSFSTVQHLDSLVGALKRLAQTEIFRLVVIGTPVYKIDGVDVEAMPWRSATEVSDLAQIDMGIMPLPDESWSRGKCGLKALQYMALGIPTVCSPVGVNSEIIQDGVNGFLADTEDEWVEKLKRLLHDKDLRARLGAAGRKTVETKYSATVQAPRVYEILHSVVAKSGARAKAPTDSKESGFSRKDAHGI